MDIIKFNNPTSPTKMEDAEIINGFKSKMWIERYRKEGEFTFVAPADIGIREKLPIGSIISHTNTEEIMIVENHEINDDKNSTSDITISGRGFETFLENRIVGSNRDFPQSGTPPEYVLSANYTWNQAVILIDDHINASSLRDDNNALPYIYVMSDVAGTGTYAERKFPRDTVFKTLMDILAVDDLGVKIIRPGIWSPLGEETENTIILIHVGNDRTQEVVFSYDTGEIVSADYLWTNKKSKNAALVTGKWVETVVLPADVGYNRRMMYVNASDIDQGYNEAPQGGILTAVVAAMQQRGREVLASQNDIALTKAETSKEAIKFMYRRDFDVGDLITVSGDYNETAYSRISEYVEIEDETGESGYPTLEG